MAQSNNYCKVHNFRWPSIYVPSFNIIWPFVYKISLGQRLDRRKKRNKERKNKQYKNNTIPNQRLGNQNKNNDKYSMSPFQRRGDIIQDTRYKIQDTKFYFVNKGLRPTIHNIFYNKLCELRIQYPCYICNSFLFKIQYM